MLDSPLLCHVLIKLLADAFHSKTLLLLLFWFRPTLSPAGGFCLYWMHVCAVAGGQHGALQGALRSDAGHCRPGSAARVQREASDNVGVDRGREGTATSLFRSVVLHDASARAVAVSRLHLSLIHRLVSDGGRRLISMMLIEDNTPFSVS